MLLAQTLIGTLADSFRNLEYCSFAILDDTENLSRFRFFFLGHNDKKKGLVRKLYSYVRVHVWIGEHHGMHVYYIAHQSNNISTLKIKLKSKGLVLAVRTQLN
jgi:hypothetical protein